MANLTITVEDDVLHKARIRALERHESVNSYLADQLRRYAGAPDQYTVMAEFLQLAKKYQGGTPGKDRTWTRDELYDE